MDVPYYSEGKKLNSYRNFKHLDFMPQDFFRMLITGPSGSGKTNLLLHMLLKPLVKYNKIYLYARNLEQDGYKLLEKRLEKIAKASKIPLEDILETSNDEIIPLRELEDDDEQKLIIFDDYVSDKKQDEISKYFLGGRHKKCSSIYLSQSYYKTPKDIRLNCTHHILFKHPYKRESKSFCDDHCIDFDLYNKAFKNPYDFLYLDKVGNKTMRNFYGNI